jgi:phosphate butyryltransferase
MRIGANLLNVMQARDVSPEGLRDALGWDAATLDAILSDELSPRISELLRLATFLGVDIATLLFGREYPAKRAVKTSKNERVGVTRKDFLHYESLAAPFAGRHLEPFVMDLYHGHGNEVEVSRHPGEEFLFVLSGELRVTVEGEPFELEAGDSFYFDSSLPHSLLSITEHSRVVAAIYRGESMLHLTKGHGMKSVIEAAKLLKRQNVVLVCPDHTSLSAVNKGIEEGLIGSAYLVGRASRLEEACKGNLIYESHYNLVDVPSAAENEEEVARAGVQLIRAGKGDMLMKGCINTALFMKAVLNRESGIGTGRRLSIVSIFELPGVDRLIFLTDPAINPELFQHEEVASGIDIIENAIDVARGLGVERPRVALLEANEVPSSSIPTTLLEKDLSEREWLLADVSGPLSYDLALYPEAVAKKGLSDDPVAGKADILVVPHISGGNFLYKSWAFTMGAEVANVVLGARAPLIMTSRSDSDLTKFLTICASALYGQFLRREPRNDAAAATISAADHARGADA